MFEAEQICPYTGLRSFTEEESLYFKGREEDIDQATEQLQRNKFLMLTGASGDGKSSLIYAGIIPNARAGFLKSKYSQWCVADFRPERTPFHNLCKSIARQLDIANPYTVQAELNHGFSAIIDLYKNSKRYLDTNSIAWQLADDAGKAALKREAANLIILVDQFEEFFTNPENYHKGVPSSDSNLVLNLLLETARIALEEDLPVYVVFTMRSDYIGQCAAFRGLPEYIGFSQFFVPRLNRTQLQLVIEEPAVLSGNRITRRLTERLIHDLTEGVDQLPILQHALNQVWHAADNGKEEMDLIHYAMVGGMALNELPDDHIEKFKNWFANLPTEIKACYHKPDLQNVIDTHTNKLYEQAKEYYLQKTGMEISDKDCKAIIKNTFICLTKIDESRAVRNRMTLKEITNILGRPEFGSKEVGNALNIFREPGNTFIRPFIQDDSDTKTLKKSDVLDITHESLIRNWEYLEQWAKEEFDNYTISLDFEQQLNRWVESGKSNNFLLPIGPLTYFENWFNTLKPNAYWIARYLPEDIEQEKKLQKAETILSNSREFLARSARKHTVTRTVMRYGFKRIAVVLAIIAVITLSSFAVRDYFRKQNDYVLKSIKGETIELVSKPKLSLEFPVPVITEQLILGNTTIPEIMDGIKDTRQKIRISTGIATQLVIQGRNEPKAEILQSLSIANSLLGQLDPKTNSRELSEELKLIHDFSVTAQLAYLFKWDDTLKAIVSQNAKRSARWVSYIYEKQPQDFIDIQNLNLALENAINNKILSQEEINRLLELLSPFESTSKSIWVENKYPRDKILVRGSFQYGIRYNGLYQDLAYLYAAAGKPEKVLQCIDTLLKYQESFYQNDYTTHIENASNIAAVFFIYGTTNYLDAFVHGYCKQKNISTIEFYNRLVSRSMIEAFASGYVNFYAGGGGQQFINPNIEFADESLLQFFFAKLREEILKIEDENERNFNLALSFKNEGALRSYRKEMKGLAAAGIDHLYTIAFSHYQKVTNEYLNQLIPTVGIASADMLTMPRKFLFLFPDFRVTFHPFEPRTLVHYFNTHSFVKYVLDQNLFDTLYQSAEDLKYFQLWFLDYHATMSTRDGFLRDPMPAATMDKLASKMEERNASKSVDLNILYLHLSENAFYEKGSGKAIEYLKKIQPDKLLNAFQYKNFDFINSYSFELVGNAIAHLAINNQFDLAFRFLNVFKKEVNRSSLYAYASQLASINQQKTELGQRLLDSAIVEMKRIDNPSVFQPNRVQVAMAMMYINPHKHSEEAHRLIKNSSDKFAAIVGFARAYVFNKELYEGQRQTPSLISAADNSFFLRNILDAYNVMETKKKEWKKFKNNELIFTRLYLPYVNESE